MLACPQCHSEAGSEVVDTRAVRGRATVRRRRVCRGCGWRFTTYETVADPAVFDGQRTRAKAVAAQLRDMASTLEVW